MTRLYLLLAEPRRNPLNRPGFPSKLRHDAGLTRRACARANPLHAALGAGQGVARARTPLAGRAGTQPAHQKTQAFYSPSDLFLIRLFVLKVRRYVQRPQTLSFTASLLGPGDGRGPMCAGDPQVLVCWRVWSLPALCLRCWPQNQHVLPKLLPNRGQGCPPSALRLLLGFWAFPESLSA